MANYDIFSQPQGPVVPISLFADAATAGINAGNALPTGLTAAIQGGIKGFGEGLDFVAKQNANALSAAKVADIPTDAALKQTELENNQAVAKINQTKAAVAVTTEALQIEDTQANLQNDLSKNQHELQSRNEEDQFAKTFASLDPQSQLDAVFSGKNTPFFANNPKAYQTYLTQSLSNPYITPQQQQAAMIGLKRGAVNDVYGKDQVKAQFELAQLDDAFKGNTVVGQIAKESNLTFDQIPKDVSSAPQGKFKVTDGYLDRDFVTKAFVPDSAGISLDPHALMFYNNKTGQVYNVTGTKEDAALINKVGGLQNRAGTTMRNRALAQVDAESKQNGATQQPQAQTPTQSNIQVTDPYKAQAQKILAVPEATFTKIEPSLDLLKSKVLSTINDPKLRGAAGRVAIDQVAATIGKTISDAEFDANPAIQAQNTQSHVDEYNRSIDEEYFKKNPVADVGVGGFGNPTFNFRIPSVSFIGSVGQPTISLDYSNKSVRDAYKISTPKDLYYVKQRPELKISFDSLIDSISKQATSSQNQVVNGVRAKSNATNILAKISG